MEDEINDLRYIPENYLLNHLIGKRNLRSGKLIRKKMKLRSSICSGPRRAVDKPEKGSGRRKSGGEEDKLSLWNFLEKEFKIRSRIKRN